MRGHEVPRGQELALGVQQHLSIWGAVADGHVSGLSREGGGSTHRAEGASPRTQPYCVGTAKRPLSAPPSNPARAPCSSFCRGVTLLSRAEGLGTTAEAGSRGPAYSGRSSWAVALMCSSFWKVF